MKNDLHYARSEVVENQGQQLNGRYFIGMKIEFGVDNSILTH